MASKKRMDQIRNILRSYVSSGYNVKVTSRVLGISKNTVKEYVRRAQQSFPDVREALHLDDTHFHELMYREEVRKSDGRQKEFEEHCEVLVTVLPFSQYSYCIALPSQKIGDFIHGINEALRFIGAVPQSILSDNLRSYVSKSERYEPTFTHLHNYANRWVLTTNLIYKQLGFVIHATRQVLKMVLDKFIEEYLPPCVIKSFILLNN